MTESFPRQKAATRSFRLGAPRNFSIKPTGDAILFLRSATGRTATTDIWLAEKIESSWSERCLVQSAHISRGGEIPAEELARRERMREVTEGVTAYSTDKTFTRITYVLDGELYVQHLPQRLDDVIEFPLQIHTGGRCIDPRMSPDGNHIAFVQDGALFAFDVTTETVNRLCGPTETEENVSWGLADFVAAEELERMRGYWWEADSQSLIVERVDESAVDISWIADPANPLAPAREHRYPFAGTANAEISLHLVNLNGVTKEIPWNKDTHPYLVSVSTSGSATTFSVLSRNQQDVEIFSLSGSVPTLLQTRIERPWHTVASGVPTLNEVGQLIEIRPLNNVFRLCVDGEAISPVEIQVTGVLSTNGDIYYVGQSETSNQHIYSIEKGQLSSRENIESLNSGVHEGDLLVVAHSNFATTKAHYWLFDLNDPASPKYTFTNNAESPVVTPNVMVESTGKLNLKSAIIWPENHVAGTKIPVICSPYGGPHHARVIASGLSFCSDQWLANQGFAVLITDNRGTPGHGPDFEYSISNDLATKVVQDQVDALTELGQRHPDLDLDRVGIHGWSFGGYLAALATMDRPDIFKAGIAGAPVTDWALYDTAYTERYLGLPGENAEAYKATSLINRANKLDRPLLLIHGLSDDNVLVAHSLRLSSALLAAGKAHSVLPLSGITHMTTQEIIAENLMLAELEFFHEHLQ
jgi:dipeptidyl-peptidase-4